MVNIKNALILNALGLIPLAALIFLQPAYLKILVLCLWLVYEIIINYKIFVGDLKQTDWRKELLNAGRSGTFVHERKKLVVAYDSLLNRKEFFANLDPGDKNRILYEKAVAQCLSDVKSAAQFITNYDYVMKPNTAYIAELSNDATALAAKISQMVELLIRVESAEDDVNVEELDLMLDSLQTILKMN